MSISRAGSAWGMSMLNPPWVCSAMDPSLDVQQLDDKPGFLFLIFFFLVTMVLFHFSSFRLGFQGGWCCGQICHCCKDFARILASDRSSFVCSLNFLFCCSPLFLLSDFVELLRTSTPLSQWTGESKSQSGSKALRSPSSTEGVISKRAAAPRGRVRIATTIRLLYLRHTASGGSGMRNAC